MVEVTQDAEGLMAELRPLGRRMVWLVVCSRCEQRTRVCNDDPEDAAEQLLAAGWRFAGPGALVCRPCDGPDDLPI